MKRPVISAMLVLALVLALVSTAGAVEIVAPQGLQPLVTQSNAVVVDLRTPAEYASGHLPGAINVPHQAIVDDAAVLDEYRDRKIVLYCRSGRRTALAVDSLERAGFDDIYHLEGDILEWQRRRLPLVEAPAR